MASPLTHIALMDRIYDKLFFQYNKKLFFLGVTIPDIRYITQQKREETHYDVTGLKSIFKEKDSFLAGTKYHLFCDYIYAKIIEGPNTTMPWKFIEDKIFSEKVQRKKYVQRLKEPNSKEYEYGSKKEIEEWHSILTLEIEKGACDETFLKIAEPLHISKDYMKKNLKIQHYFETFPETSKIINTLRDNREKILQNPKEELETILTPYKDFRKNLKYYFELEINKE